MWSLIEIFILYPNTDLEHIIVELNGGALICEQLMMLANVVPPQVIRHERFRIRQRNGNARN